MNFTDPQLQKCYEKHFAEACDVSAELRQVRALIAAHDLFQTLEGPHSSRVHETISHLLLPQLRPALHRWYRGSRAAKNSTAIALRDHLSRLAGVTLEKPADIPHNPS
jgi:glucose-6-phosphate dehydrogenase assembly protein OpcA